MITCSSKIWIVSDKDHLPAVLFYGGLLFLCGILHNALWRYAAYASGLTRSDLTPRERRTLTLTWAGGPFLYGVCLLLALIDSRLSIVGFAFIAVLYLLPTPQLLARAQRMRAKRRAGDHRTPHVTKETHR